MGTQIFLGLNALIWLGYGVFCLVRPSFLDGAAGVAARSETGIAELRAMYGGLQAAIGALCFLGMMAPAWTGHALVTVGFLVAGLASFRLLAVAIGGGLSGYTIGALVFEIPSAAAAFYFLAQLSA